MNLRMKRRTFLKQGTMAGAGIMVLKSGILKAGNSPNEKLNIAIIGGEAPGQLSTRGPDGSQNVP